MKVVKGPGAAALAALLWLSACTALRGPPASMPADIAFSRGVELAWDDERDAARLHFEHAVAVDPSHDRARAQLAVLLFEDGKPAEAQALLQEALTLRPNSAPLLQARGDLHAARGAHELALADYLAAFRQAPARIQVRDRIVHSRLLLGEWPRVEQDLRQDCARDQRRTALCPPDTLEMLAQVMLVRGDPAGSSALLQEAAQYQIQEGRTLLWKYLADQRVGGDDAARAALQRHAHLIPPGVWRELSERVLRDGPPAPLPLSDPPACELLVLAERLGVPLAVDKPAAGRPMPAADPCTGSPLLGAFRGPPAVDGGPRSGG